MIRAQTSADVLKGGIALHRNVCTRKHAVESEIRARASKIPKPGRNPQEGCVLEHMPRYYSRPRCCPRADESADKAPSLHEYRHLASSSTIYRTSSSLRIDLRRNCSEAVIFSSSQVYDLPDWFYNQIIQDIFRTRFVHESSSSFRKKKVDGSVEEEIGNFFLLVL